MGVTKKKPAAKATAARKVKLSRSEVELAKHFNVPLEEVAKAKLPKRGRPVGSKNKPKLLEKTLSKRSVPDFPVPKNTVDWERLAKNLQEALAAEMKENEALEAILKEFKSVIRPDTSFTFWDRLVFLFSGKV